MADADGLVTGEPSDESSARSLIPGMTDPRDLPPAPMEPTDDTPTRSSTWELLGVAGQGRVLGIRVAAGGCAELSHFRVLETATSVVVEPFLKDTANGSGPCVQSAQLFDSRIDLAAPLGDRRLVSGYDNSTVSIR